MKKIFLALSLSLLNSCKSQNNITMIPTVDNKFERFDFLTWNSRKDRSSLTHRAYLPNGNYMEIIMANSGGSYSESISNSFFKILKSYYKNGNIEIKGVGFNGDSFQMGTWYEFDENGNLIKEIDYDKPFKFTFEDIVKFCERENIPLTKGPIMQSTGFHTTIRRSVENNKAIWQIEWLKKPDIIEKILIDGVTGEVISKKDMKYINN